MDETTATEVKTRTKPLYAWIAGACGARKRCLEHGNEFAARWDEELDWVEKNALPSGSGIDSGTTIDRDASHDELVVLETSYHHMNDVGSYDGWTQHTIRVRPSFLGGFKLSISGPNRNDIKEYLHQTYDCALSMMLEQHENSGSFRLVHD